MCIPHSTSDADECATFPCLNGGTCTDQEFDYECSCPPAFSGLNCEIGKLTYFLFRAYSVHYENSDDILVYNFCNILDMSSAHACCVESVLISKCKHVCTLGYSQ